MNFAAPRSSRPAGGRYPRLGALLRPPPNVDLRPTPPTILPLHFPIEDTPLPGQLMPVAPGVYWVRMPLPFALDHINLWLLEDGEGWTLIDTGLGVEATRDHWRAVFEAAPGGRPLRRIIVTHFHPDHIGCAAWLSAQWQAPVWMPQAEFLTAHAVAAQLPGFDVESMLTHFARHGLDAARLAQLRARGNAYSRVAPELPQQFRRLLPDETLEIGAHRWQVITGFGHSPEHAALHCAALGVLISGDMLLPRISTNVSVPAATPEADVLRWFLRSLEAFAALPPQTLVLPSHGRPFVDIAERVAQLVAHHAARCDEIVAALANPTTPATAADLLPLLFPRELDNHQLMFALGEAIAHLNFLCHDGRVIAAPADDGIMHFVTVTAIPG